MRDGTDLLPRIAILCNPALAGSYYVVVGAALDWVDPASFLALEAIFLLPVALGIFCWRFRQTSVLTLIQGFLLGVILFVNMSVSIWSLAFTSVTNAGFYPALIGPLTVLVTWLVFGARLRSLHLLVSILALLGSAALIGSGVDGSGNWRGDLLALFATLIFVCYVLMLERVAVSRRDPIGLWASQMISVSVLAALVCVLFGKTDLSALLSDKALVVGGYSAVFTTMLPILFATYAQRYLSSVFVSFTYLLEPIWAAFLAFLFLHEQIGALQFIGGVFVLSSSFAMWIGDRRVEVVVDPTLSEGERSGLA